jgi:hypothetical protein
MESDSFLHLQSTWGVYLDTGTGDGPAARADDFDGGRCWCWEALVAQCFIFLAVFRAPNAHFCRGVLYRRCALNLGSAFEAGGLCFPNKLLLWPLAQSTFLSGCYSLQMVLVFL